MCLWLRLDRACTPSRLPLVDEQPAPLCIVLVMHVSTILKLVCLDLPMHITCCRIHRPALSAISLLAVGKRLKSKRAVAANPVLIIGSDNLVRVSVAGVDRLAPLLVRRRELSNKG